VQPHGTEKSKTKGLKVGLGGIEGDEGPEE